MKDSTKRVAFAGMFIALSIIFTRFLSHTFLIAGMPALRLSFGDLPLIILSGIVLGPVYGAFTGVLAD
jgi:ECF transporter S component (folate family)